MYKEFKYDNDWDFWSLFKSKPSVHFNATISVPKSIDVDLHTSGGHIEIDGIEGEVGARTSGGHMKLAHIGGLAKAHTGGGSITATDSRSEADLSTSGGRIKVDSIAGNSKLKTSGGSITAKLPRGEQFYLSARTSGGGVSTDFPFNMTGELKRSQTAEGPVNGGGPLLETLEFLLPLASSS